MNNTTINGALLKEMFLTGAALLEKNKAYVDSLNVFPVPDGDTGTNMSMTMQSAVKEIKACNGGSTVGEVAAAASLGALKGARGNSGVILSQIFRGFAKALKGCEEMDAELLANALRMGTESAYKAVMKPKEGTILTVSRMISTAVEGEFNQGANVFGLIDVMIESGEEALRQTPELLPVLKEAGVVDSGGKGLMTIYRGFKMVVDGDAIDDYVAEQQEAVTPEDNDLSLEDVNDIKFGYCTEFFVIHLVESFTEGDLEKFRDKLMKIGDSVVVAHDADFIKIHVHTNMPGKALQLALCLGELDKVKIENMREQNRAIQENIKKNETENAMVAVSAGEGMDSEFTGAGVGVIISGGQTMNPSIDTIAKAIRKANARNVFVLQYNYGGPAGGGAFRPQRNSHTYKDHDAGNGGGHGLCPREYSGGKPQAHGKGRGKRRIGCGNICRKGYLLQRPDYSQGRYNRPQGQRHNLRGQDRGGRYAFSCGKDA